MTIGEPTGAGSGDPQKEPLTPERDKEISEIVAVWTEEKSSVMDMSDVLREKGVTEEELKLWNEQDGRNYSTLSTIVREKLLEKNKKSVETEK
jgi:hypothetical protein